MIPSLKHLYDRDKEWFGGWQISSDYSVHPSTARKLRRQGILVGRDLKDKEGQVYYTIYLISENQKFLREYPRNEK